MPDTTPQNDRISDLLARLPQARSMTAEVQRDYRSAKKAAWDDSRGERAANVAAWRVANPERSAAMLSRRAVSRRANLLAARDGVSTDILAQADQLCADWRDAADWTCGYCRKSVSRCDRTADHVIPTSKGRKHEPCNLRPACRSCNSRKAQRSEFEP